MSVALTKRSARQGRGITRPQGRAAALQRRRKAGTRGPAFEIARRRAEEFREAGKADDAAFWTEVYDFLMTRESVGAEVETIILEEGEAYDFDEAEVIRPDKNPPRKSTES